MTYERKISGGKGYSVSVPEFTGDNVGTVNKFYDTLSKETEEYFKSLCISDRHTICRCNFSVTEEDGLFSVRTVLTLRKNSRKHMERILTHRWRIWEGRDMVLDKVRNRKRKIPVFKISK